MIKGLTWVAVLSAFFARGPSKAMEELVINESQAIFFLTVSLSWAINFIFSFFVCRYGSEGRIYEVINAAILIAGRGVVQLVSQMIAVPEPVHHIQMKVNKLELTTVCESTRSCTSEGVHQYGAQVNDPFPTEVNGSNSHETSSWPAKKVKSKITKGILGDLKPFIIGTVLITIIMLLIFQLDYFKFNGYHVTFKYDFVSQGFPLVSYDKDSPKGAICIEGRSDFEVSRIARVTAKSSNIKSDKMVMALSNVSRLNVKTSSNSEDDMFTKVFLHPKCEGNEVNLLDCHHKGLGVDIPNSCLTNYSFNILNLLHLNFAFREGDITSSSYDAVYYSYHFHNVDASYDEAFLFCRDAGGFLARFRDIQDVLHMGTHFVYLKVDAVWISSKQVADVIERSSTRSSPHPMPPRFLNTSYALQREYMIDYTSEDRRFPFLCKIPSKKLDPMQGVSKIEILQFNHIFGT